MLGGLVGLPPGSEPTSEVVVYHTNWEVPSNALAGEKAHLIRRGVLPDPAVGSPGERGSGEISPRAGWGVIWLAVCVVLGWHPMM
ncbi:hypothetical protein [Nocardia fluminea]|uniref:hypothetical protein n=1 Tax=Nocardia fluminea TaxID=134984 RepID=UPI00365D577B